MDNVLWKKKKNYIYTNTRWKDSITRKILKVRCFSRRHMWNKENRENIFMMTASDIFYTLIKAMSIQMLHKVASQKKNGMFSVTLATKEETSRGVAMRVF